MTRVHFIAIGGSAMHNLAIALHQKGYKVSGSDDEIFDPAKSRLEKYGLLPDTIGWNPERITSDLDAVILGMHARIDNPELLRAKELGIRIFSYPEYLYEQSKHKTRVVIGGSHGKTTVTAMILHVLQYAGVKTDYMVGAQLEGFEVMVRLSDDAGVMVLEGDGTDSDILDEEGFKEMDAFVALTGIDEENIILALNALQANVKKVITKVNHIRENSTLYTLGIDTYISPKDVTANKIVSYVRAMQNSFGSNVEAMSKIVSGKVEALEFVVKRNMPFINIPLMHLKFKNNLLIGCIVRNGEIIYPKGNDVILTDDHIIVVTTQEGLQDVTDIFAK